MGSQLTKNYDVEKDITGLGGIHNMWKIYKATKKDKLRTPVSIFMFEKKALDRLSKNDKETVLSNLRKEPALLAKYKHPGIVNLYEPLIEDAKVMAFVTEPIECSYAYLEHKLDLIPSELESKIQVVELCETLSFLHNTAKLVHLSFSPENIYLSSEGKIKVGGFAFSHVSMSNEEEPCTLDFVEASRVHESLAPNLKFIAPEVTNINKCSRYSDMFSLGCLLYYIVQLSRTDKLKNSDLYLLKMTDSSNPKQHSYECESLETKKNKILGDLGNPNLASLIDKMINTRHAGSRGEAIDALKSPWFNDPLIKALHYLDKIIEKDQNSKQQFLTGLLSILDRFEDRVLMKKIIPRLVELLQNEALVSAILPCLFKLMEKKDLIRSDIFLNKMWPSIQKLCTGKEMSAQALFMLIKNTELFFKYVDGKEFQTALMPLSLKALECGVFKLQEEALSKIPLISKKVEYNVLKSQILPRILHLLVDTKISQLKIQCITCLKDFLGVIDRTTMTDVVLVALEKLRKSENDGKILMVLLEMYEIMSKALGNEITANRILPNMIPVLISGNLTRDQFKKFTITIRKMLDNIESSRIKDLDEVSTNVESETFNFEQQFGKEGLGKDLTAQPKAEGGGLFDFLDILDQSNTTTTSPMQPQPSGLGQQTFPSQTFTPQQTPPSNRRTPSQTQFDVKQPSSSSLNFLSGPTVFAPTNNASSGIQPLKPPQNRSSDINDIFSGIGLSEEKKSPSKEGWGFGDDLFSSLGRKQTNNNVQFNMAPKQQPLNFIKPAGGIGGLNLLGGPMKGNLLNMQEDPFADINNEMGGSNTNGMSGMFSQPPQQKPSAYPQTSFNAQPNFVVKDAFGVGSSNGFAQGNFNFMGSGGGGGGFLGSQQQQPQNTGLPYGTFPSQARGPAAGAGFGGSMGVNNSKKIEFPSSTDDFFEQFATQQQKPGGTNPFSNISGPGNDQKGGFSNW